MAEENKDATQQPTPKDCPHASQSTPSGKGGASVNRFNFWLLLAIAAKLADTRVHLSRLTTIPQSEVDRRLEELVDSGVLSYAKRQSQDKRSFGRIYQIDMKRLKCLLNDDTKWNLDDSAENTCHLFYVQKTQQGESNGVGGFGNGGEVAKMRTEKISGNRRGRKKKNNRIGSGLRGKQTLEQKKCLDEFADKIPELRADIEKDLKEKGEFIPNKTKISVEKCALKFARKYKRCESYPNGKDPSYSYHKDLASAYRTRVKKTSSRKKR